MSETRKRTKYSPVRNKRAGQVNTRQAREDLIAVPSDADTPLEVAITDLNGVLGRVRVIIAQIKGMFVSRPASGGSTDNAVARFDGTDGKLIQDSNAIFEDDEFKFQPGTTDKARISLLNASQKWAIEVGTDDIFRLEDVTGFNTDYITCRGSASGAPFEVAINDQQGDVDFRVEGNNSDHVLFVEAATDRVGIGTASPASELEVDGDIASVRAATNATLTLTREDQNSWRLTSSGNGSLIIRDQTGSTNVVQIEAGANAASLYIDSAGQVGVGGVTVPASPLHVDQAASDGAVPVLTLDQGDDSEEMIEFVGTIGTGNALEAVAAKTLTTTHFIKVTLPGGLTRYIPCGTIA